MSTYQINFSSNKEKEIFDTLEKEAKKSKKTPKNFILNLLRKELESPSEDKKETGDDLKKLILDLEARVKNLENPKEIKTPRRVKRISSKRSIDLGFYELLDQVLDQKKIKVKDLASKVKISYNSFRPYRSGKRFSPEQIKKIKRVIESL